MLMFQNVFHWLAQNPLGIATVVYAVGVCVVLVHAYFEPRDER